MADAKLALCRLRASLLLLCVLGGGARAADVAEPKSIQYGFEQRTRTENWNNIIDYNDAYDDQRNQIRWRTRAWLQAPLTSDIDVFVGLNQETNQIVVPRRPWRMDEVVIESAYVDLKRLFVKGLSLRVGRQNLMKGEGWLILDGTPLDGSRNIYFNAANLAYERGKSKIELIGISNPKRDQYLPSLRDLNRINNEWDEQAVGAWFTNKSSRKTSVELYYFLKKEIRDYRAPTNPQFQPDRHVNTAGGRVVRQLNQGWSLTGELTQQWGAQHPNTAIRAWGGYAYAKRTFRHAWKPYALTGCWAMSGDDPTTKNRIEGWDPLFSRWPKWSELYVYSQFRERGPGYWTNLWMWQSEAGFSPRKPLGFRFTYYHVGAFQTFPGDKTVFGTGLRRGENLQARMDVTAGKHWAGHVLYEDLLAGDFYQAHRPGYFLRFEVSFLIKGKLAVGKPRAN